MSFLDLLCRLLQGLCLLPVVVGSVYGLLAAVAVHLFCRRRPAPLADDPPAAWPPVTILKPIYGLDKNLAANLRSTCTQDYPTYQVVLSAQRLDEPALPLLREIEREFGPERVTVAVADSKPVVNGRVQNLLIGLGGARHDILVTSDSDMLLRPDYLKTIVRPLRDPGVGCVCTLYRAAGADRWFERLELLSLNAEFVANLIFARMTGASMFCLGASTALRRSTLEDIGGFAALRDYLVEDFELGRRVRGKGLRMALPAYFADTIVDLKDAGEWWGHQVYWDQNTRAARPIGFFATIVLKSVPFGLVFACLRVFDLAGVSAFGAAVAMRLASTAVVLRSIGDDEGLRSLGWMVVRDLAGLLSWLVALTKRSFVWRGEEFQLTGDGRIVPRRATT
jgi:ceramide glucosyltransferase